MTEFQKLTKSAQGAVRDSSDCQFSLWEAEAGRTLDLRFIHDPLELKTVKLCLKIWHLARTSSVSRLLCFVRRYFGLKTQKHSHAYVVLIGTQEIHEQMDIGCLPGFLFNSDVSLYCFIDIWAPIDK